MQKTTRPGDDLVVYLEGDGHAWVSRRQVSTDPTPRQTLVRDWAAHDIRPNVLYLARPCQYVAMFQAPCHNDYWTAKRFAPDVIASMNDAVDQAMASAKATHVTLIGYSGGGAVAALIAARRDDVRRIVTVAGNLDIAGHSALHHVSPLEGSLNPLDAAPLLGHVTQRHYVGEQDINVPRIIAERFIRALPPGTDVRMITVPGATHDRHWSGIDF